jgi:hypothetical protein
MSAPYEILAAPMDIYVAAANTAEPAVDAAPGGSWTLLGTTGDGNYDEDGVQITHAQELEFFRPLGSTGRRKSWRTEEDPKVEATVYDITAEHYRRALNDAAITTVAAGSGIPGSKRLALKQGYDVTTLALLLRADSSPYGDGWKMQYWIPLAVNASSPEPVYKKGEPAGLKFEWEVLDDVTNGFGVVRFQTATAL